jgi:hypothetical protein
MLKTSANQSIKEDTNVCTNEKVKKAPRKRSKKDTKTQNETKGVNADYFYCPTIFTMDPP